MKVRITTGLSAGLLALAGLIWIETPLVLCLVVGFSVIAAHEICHAVQMKNRAMIAVSMAMAALLPPVLAYWPAISGRLHIPALLLLLGYLLLLLALMLAQFDKTRCSHVLYALLASLLVPGALAAIPMLRGFAPEKNLAVWLLLFTLCGAWVTDIFALFVGVKFGRHKLAPHISPKKTVEGAVGGLVGCVLMNLGFALLFNRFFLEQHKINLLGVALLSLAAGVVSMMGDLAASVLKRNHGVKDFGKIFPGHGGVMDRFDSLVLVTPFVYALLQLQQNLGLPILFGPAL
ncbi:MAG: phosphatidate cytidylyltransferase [Oscillospiraceae bacterium]|nr:phosphatidate cytidylyltransferase [Oscillospiraceae bacterium]